MNKLIVSMIVCAVVFGAAGFWGGIFYQKSQTVRSGGNFGRNAGNFELQAANQTRRSGGLQGGFTSGEIISKDNNSITLKLREGTRIIFYSSSTQISKQASATADDLAVGSTAMVTGTANTDGSVLAQTISLRPAGAAPYPAGPAGNNGSQTNNPGGGNPPAQDQ